MNGAQGRQSFDAKCAGGDSDAGGNARVSCVAHWEPTRGPVSLLACGDLSWCTRGVESNAGIRCGAVNYRHCSVVAETVVLLLEK